MENKNTDSHFTYEYLEQVNKLIKDMLALSNMGIKEFKGNDFLVLCGVIRDSAFKIKKALTKITDTKIGG